MASLPGKLIHVCMETGFSEQNCVTFIFMIFCIEVDMALHFSFPSVLAEECVWLVENIGEPPVVKIFAVGDVQNA